MMKSPGFLFALSPKPHPEWNNFLKSSSSLLSEIEKKIKDSGFPFTPQTNRVLRFLILPPSSIKIIILGQDPYPQQGVATGRAFEVGNLISWDQKFRNISLKNIVRAIYHAYKNDYRTYSEIIKEIHTGSKSSFQLMPPNQLFKNWEKQGVLLLNTAFTCEINRPGSHSEIWQPFTKELLQYVSAVCPDLIWFLWGNHAQNITSGIQIKNKLVSMHPMMCYKDNNRNDDFLYGKINHFKETKHIIDWRGK